MFGHRVSKFGYVLAALCLTNAIVMSVYRIPDHTLLEALRFFTATGFVVSFCAVFLGVIARGFERVEAAIREQRMEGRS